MTSSYIREGYGSFRFHEGGRCFSRGDYTFLASLVFGHVLQSKKTKRMRCGSPGLHNMRPAEAFLAARESFLSCRKRCKSSTSSNCRSRISCILQRIEMEFCDLRQIYVDNLALRAFWVVQACRNTPGRQMNMHHMRVCNWRLSQFSKCSIYCLRAFSTRDWSVSKLHACSLFLFDLLCHLFNATRV